MEIRQRKDSSNEVDALSRRPELHHTIATAEQKLLGKHLEDMHNFLCMSHLQVNDATINEFDPDMHKSLLIAIQPSLTNGVRFDASDNLYWMADRICLPNDISLRDLILTKYHKHAGHTDPNRTLLKVSKMFWWPRMRNAIIHNCKSYATCQSIKALTTPKLFYSLFPLPKTTCP
jgi:hypothetical protein